MGGVREAGGVLAAQLDLAGERVAEAGGTRRRRRRRARRRSPPWPRAPSRRRGARARGPPSRGRGGRRGPAGRRRRRGPPPPPTAPAPPAAARAAGRRAARARAARASPAGRRASRAARRHVDVLIPHQERHRAAEVGELREVLAERAQLCGRLASEPGLGVHVVEQAGRVRQVEVVAQVGLGLLARRAVERHVEGDQAGALLVGGTVLVLDDAGVDVGDRRVLDRLGVRLGDGGLVGAADRRRGRASGTGRARRRGWSRRAGRRRRSAAATGPRRPWWRRRARRRAGCAARSPSRSMRSSIAVAASDTRVTWSRASAPASARACLGGLAGLLADAARLEVGLALDVGGALLGGLDDQADLLGGGGRQGAAGAVRAARRPPARRPAGSGARPRPPGRSPGGPMGKSRFSMDCRSKAMRAHPTVAEGDAFDDQARRARGRPSPAPRRPAAAPPPAAPRRCGRAGSGRCPRSARACACGGRPDRGCRAHVATQGTVPTVAPAGGADGGAELHHRLVDGRARAAARVP